MKYEQVYFAVRLQDLKGNRAMAQGACGPLLRMGEKPRVVRVRVTMEEVR